MLKTVSRGRVLVLAPHPDDETIGCGGAISLHRRRGDPVKVVFATDGSAGDPRGYFKDRNLVEIRRLEARRAVRALGGAELEFWNLRDGRLSRAHGLEDKILELLRSYRPNVVYRPSLSDPHPDHRALGRRFESAAVRWENRFIDLRYEVCFLQKPSLVVDVSAVFKRKMRALGEYRSQLRYRDYQAIAERTGMLRGLFLDRPGFAEAFRA